MEELVVSLLFSYFLQNVCTVVQPSPTTALSSSTLMQSGVPPPGSANDYRCAAGVWEALCLGQTDSVLWKS